MNIKKTIFFATIFLSTLVFAEIPDGYKTVVVKPPFSFNERVVDFNPAISQAKVENKSLMIYLGATDCPPCRQYENFLNKNKKALSPYFEKIIVVDIQTWLRGATLKFKVGENLYTFDEFNKFIENEKIPYVYPSWFLVTNELKSASQVRGKYITNDLKSHQEMIDFLVEFKPISSK